MRRAITAHLPRLLTIFAFCALLACGLLTATAPAPRAPERSTDFSIQHAQAHVRAIATRPHPAGSAANADTRAYLLAQLDRLNLAPRVHTATVRHPRDEQTYTLHNILARLPGKATTHPATQAATRPAVLLACHYDTVRAGPGAADDTAAVAALLETARALRAAPPPAHDILFLFTDGEELGMLGAQALLDDPSPPIPNDQFPIPLVFNFDARGTAGPSLMFETAPHNLSLIRHFAAAAPRPIANSLAYDVYRMLPNNTDFTIFRRAGMQGLNFAFINNAFYYHTKNDTPENLDPASLYHHGQHALALARHFANLSTEQLAAVRAPDQPDALYFNVCPAWLVVYPATWGWPLTIAQGVLTVAAAVVIVRRRRPGWRAFAVVALCAVLSFVVVPLAVTGLASLLGRPTSPQRFNLALASVIALASLVTLACAWLGRRPHYRAARPVIVLVLLLAIGVAANVYVPGGTPLIVWPALVLALAHLAAPYLPACRWTRAALTILVLAPTLLILTPMIVQVFSALTLARAGLCSAGVVLVTWMLLAAAQPPRDPAPSDVVQAV